EHRPRFEVPRVRRRLSQGRRPRLRDVLRSARGRVRLHRRFPAHDPRGDRVAAAQPLALSRAAAGRRRAERGAAFRIHAGGAGREGRAVVASQGDSDDAKRLRSEIADTSGGASVHVTLRPEYAGGAKTYGFEIAEQLGWRPPKHVVIPTAGGTILPKVHKA